MLDPRNRAVLFSVLRPPDGYDLDQAIGTTYSLDLLALLTAPLAFTLFDHNDKNGRIEADPMALLESLRRYSSRITIFCQAGNIKLPPQNQPLVCHLESSVVQVKAPRAGGVFHAKVWVLRFTSPTDPPHYRLLCFSRNLTFDRCWDTVLALDGRLQDRQKAIAANHPLADFVAALPGMAVPAPPDAVHRRVALLADEVRRVRFDLPEGFDDLRFWPLGVDGYTKWPFSGRVDQLAVISPFLSAGALKRLTKEANGQLLVSRPEELESISPEDLRSFGRICVLADRAEPEATDDSVEQHFYQAPPAGLHAKLYIADAGWKARVWTGSANATHAAFDQNVEFLVELEGKKSFCGIAALLGGDAKPCLDDMLQPFVVGDRPREIDPVETELEKLLQEARLLLATGTVEAAIEPTGDQFRLHISIQCPGPLPAGVQVRCWPITLRSESAASVTGTQPLRLTFGPVTLEALTSFVAFEATATKEKQSASCRFVVNATLTGAPADRQQRLLVSMLGDRGRLIRFLLLLLADNVVDARQALAPTGNEGAATDSTALFGEGQLFESLVQALDRQPRKLDQVARLMADLAKTERGVALVPDGFEAIWQPIWASRQRLAP